jgi:hypothetical protein
MANHLQHHPSPPLRHRGSELARWRPLNRHLFVTVSPTDSRAHRYRTSPLHAQALTNGPHASTLGPFVLSSFSSRSRLAHKHE